MALAHQGFAFVAAAHDPTFVPPIPTNALNAIFGPTVITSFPGETKAVIGTFPTGVGDPGIEVSVND